MTAPLRQSPALGRLRRFAAGPGPEERCDLCSVPLLDSHQHLIEPANRRMNCCCDACAVLFDGQLSARYRRIPRRITSLTPFQLPESDWQALGVPVGLAFFFRSSALNEVLAQYPSPAGAVESAVTPEAWAVVVAAHPALQAMQPDVEALLVNRTAAEPTCFIAPIDECFRLVGLVRTHWQGLTGGQEPQVQIRQFLAELQERAH